MTVSRQRRRAVRSEREVSGPPLLHRVLLIVAAIIAMLSAARAVQQSVEQPAATRIEVVGAPSVITDEADVFRTRLLGIGDCPDRLLLVFIEQGPNSSGGPFSFDQSRCNCLCVFQIAWRDRRRRELQIFGLIRI